MMMLGKLSAVIVFFGGGLLAMCRPVWAADANSGFRDVLEMAELGPEVLAKFSDISEGKIEDWQLLVQLLHRLGQYSPAEQAAWALAWDGPTKPLVGDLVDVVGTVEAVESLTLPAQISQAHKLTTLYRCRFRFSQSRTGQSQTDEPGMIGTVLAAQIPHGWHTAKPLAEPAGFRGILLRNSADEPQNKVLFLAQRFSWFPKQGVPTGQLLLARHGMDVALLEEVRHGKPFVGAEVSREGEAFYGCLAAMNRVDASELATLSKQAVAQFAKRGRDSKSTTGQQRALAARVQQRSELGLSSVAPLFLQPKQMAGRLVRIEGMARRAVRIAVADRPELDSYFELEIFPPDSQNQPVVCCVQHLPAEFPTGDVIREPVRIAGVFFKGWVYRGREVQKIAGETGRQQRMYTPVIVGAVEWLPRSASQDSRWGLWGGIAFLLVLIIVALNAVRLAKKDRHARAAQRNLDSVELPKNL